MPGSKGTFSQDVWRLVEDVVKNRQTQVWLPNVIDVGKNQADVRTNKVPFFQNLIVFTADIAPWFLDMVQYFFKLM